MVRQCTLLSLNRSTAYYRPRGESEENLAVTEEIDRLYMERPTSGSRTIKSMLSERKASASPEAASFASCGPAGHLPEAPTSSPGAGHKVYPYLLRNIKVVRPRQVYAADITYIPMAKGFLYLVAVIDWHSRKVLAHRARRCLLRRSP